MDLINILLFILYFYTCIFVAFITKPTSFDMTKSCLFLIVLLSFLYVKLLKIPIIHDFKIAITLFFIIIILRSFMYETLFLSIKVALMTILIMILGESITGTLFINILNIPFQRIINQISILLLFNITVFVVSLGLGVIIKKICKLTYSLNSSKSNRINIFFNCILACSLLFFYYYMYKHYNEDAYLIILSITITYLFLLLLLINKNNILKFQNDEYRKLKLYTDVIENLLTDVNTFRHDYRNMLSTIDGYLDNDDLEGLKKYSLENNKVSNFLNIEITSLKNIKESGLKGLLANQITKMHSNDIKVILNVFNTIDHFEMDTFDLSRIIGILLDNAYEAAKNSDEKIIYIHFIQENYLNITISNSFHEKPNLNDIFKKGFSTKGEKRGLGLYIVNHILNKKYSNASLQTSVKGNLFIQELFIFK